MEAPRTALVTGALGQDGSLLVEQLLSRGYRVVGVVKPTTIPPAQSAGATASYISVDMADLGAVREAIEKWQPSEVYHLAAFHHSAQDAAASSAYSAKDLILTTNFIYTKNLAFALAESGLDSHLVFAASSQMYTPSVETDEIVESSPRQPTTFYGQAKAWSMDLLAFLRRDVGLRASGAILFNHESTRRGAQFVSRKITRAAALAAAGGQPRLQLQNVGARVDWSSAHDVVDALALMGAAREPGDHIVASGRLHSVRDLLDVAFGHVGLDWRKYAVASEDRLTPALVGSPRALVQRLGWRRRVSFEEMVRGMVGHDSMALAAERTPHI